MEAAPKRVVGRPFQKGQSGNPGGRRKAVLTQALLEKLTPAKADAVAAKALALALAGEPWAMQLVWDRLEGKAIARNENGGPGDFELDENESAQLRAALKVVRGRRES